LKIAKITVKYDVVLIEDAFYSVFVLGEAIQKTQESHSWKTNPSVYGEGNTG
jgi:DNA-binding transcriptional MocR family regulator